MCKLKIAIDIFITVDYDQVAIPHESNRLLKDHYLLLLSFNKNPTMNLKESENWKRLWLLNPLSDESEYQNLVNPVLTNCVDKGKCRKLIILFNWLIYLKHLTIAYRLKKRTVF